MALDEIKFIFADAGYPGQKAGTIIGTGGTAIEFAGSGNTLTLGAGYLISGIVDPLSGSNTFQLGGTGSDAFDLSPIGATARYRGFTIFNVQLHAFLLRSPPTRRVQSSYKAAYRPKTSPCSTSCRCESVDRSFLWQPGLSPGIQIADVLTDQDYPHDDPRSAALRSEGVRALLCVPMIKGDELIGAITIFRQELPPFTDKQIELIENFAAQAVIAIENARLLNELRQRTTDLTESTADLTEALEQQTATSEVLQVISGSRGDVQPVFATMLEKAARICGAKLGNIYRWDGEAFHLLAAHNMPPALIEARSRSPLRPDQSGALGRMVTTNAVVNIADLTAERAYVERFPAAVAAVELAGARAVLAVPMLKEDELVGAFTLFRQEVSPFTDKQVALVTNFAAQAVIAIENARLLKELRQF